MNQNHFTFTRSRLESLRSPKKGRVYYYDDVVRGLVLSVHPTGTKSFIVYRKLKGKPIKRTLGTFDPSVSETREKLSDGTEPLDLIGHSPALNVWMARRLATAVNASFDRGMDPIAEEKKARDVAEQNAFTLGNLFAHYKQQHLIRREKKSVESLTWVFERYLGDLPGGPRKKHGQVRTKPKGAVNWQQRPVAEIEAEDVSRLCASLAENVGNTTANRVLELVKAMYNFGRKKKLYVGANPAADIEKFDQQTRERFVQSHEAPRFLEALKSETDTDFRDYVWLSIYTGSRRKNLMGMRWDELSLDGAAWTLSGEQMKNGQPLVIPLVPDAVDLLRRRANKAEGDWVFPGGTPDGHMGPPRKKWAAFLTRAELTDLRLHDLRRTLGSWMTHEGANVQTTMRALGHKSIDAALIYQRLETAPIRNAMQRGVDGFFKAAKAGKAKVAEMRPRETRRLRTKSGGR